jgi:hypothetical protein
MVNYKQVISLLQKGLYLDNLEELIELCHLNIRETDHPIIPFILLKIFEGLTEYWDNQAALVNDYDNIVINLRNSIINMLSSYQVNNNMLFSELDKLIITYYDVISGFNKR